MVSTTKLHKPTKFIINNGTKDLEYEIARNNKGARLWRTTKVRIQPGQGELVKTWDSWHSGMGWSRDESRDAQYAPPVYESGGATATHRGYIYPQLKTNTISVYNEDGASPTSMDRITEMGDYIYSFSTDGTDILVHKIDPSDDSVVYMRTFSGWVAPAGQPAEFGGYLYVPSAGGVFKELTTVVDDLTGAFLISGSQTDTTYSVAVTGDDGHLRKYHVSSYSSARAATATVDTTSSAFLVGQNLTYYIWRGYLRFDTSGIGAGPSVLTAKLRVYLLNDYSETDFTLQVRKKAWGATLEAADWSATPSDDTLMGSIATDDAAWPSAGNWVEIDLDTSTIEKEAYTELYLISSRDDDDPGTTPTGPEYVQFEDLTLGASHQAQLVVTYGTAIDITDNTDNANADGGTAFTLLGDNSDDIFYWGAASKFDGVFIDIITAANTALTLDWEFWNGSAWTDIIGPETDGTTGFTVDGWVTWASAAQTSWALTTVNSVEAYYVRVKTSTAASTWPTSDWTPPSDVWTDGPSVTDSKRYAWHMGTAGKLLWRVGDNDNTIASHHVINSVANNPLAAGDWSDSADYVIGKPGRNINSLAEMGRWLYVGKEEGLFGSDASGNQTNALDFVRNLIASTNCCDTIRWLGTLVTTHKTGLWQHTGVSSRLIGIETLESNLSDIKGGRYLSLATAGEGLCVAYLLPGGSQIALLEGRPGHEDEPPVVWHHLATFTATAIDSMHISGLTTNPRLWMAFEGASKIVDYVILAQDGSPDPTDSNMTFYAAEALIDLPAVDWGMPGTPKQGHMVEIVTSQAIGTDGTVKVYYGWDDATPSTQLGSTITTPTKTQCFWPAGNTEATHWGYRPQIRIGITGHATNVLRVDKVSLYCIARPRMEDGIELTIRIADSLDKSRTAKVAYDDLDALVNAGVYDVRDPDDPAGGTFSAIVHNIAPSKGEQLGDQSGVEYVTVTLRRVEYS